MCLATSTKRTELINGRSESLRAFCSRVIANRAKRTRIGTIIRSVCRRYDSSLGISARKRAHTLPEAYKIRCQPSTFANWSSPQFLHLTVSQRHTGGETFARFANVDIEEQRAQLDYLGLFASRAVLDDFLLMLLRVRFTRLCNKLCNKLQLTNFRGEF